MASKNKAGRRVQTANGQPAQRHDCKLNKGQNQLTFDSGVWGPEGWLALTLASTSGRNIAALVPARILANVSVIMLNMQHRTGLDTGNDI